MNVKMRGGKAIHAIREDWHRGGWGMTPCKYLWREQEGDKLTDEPVTCKRCLKQPEALR